MIRAFITVVLMFIAAAAVVWLAERPGGLVLVWQGYEVRTSLMTAAVVVILAVAAITAVGSVVRRIVTTPRLVGQFLGARKRDRGYRALTRGMIAVGAGDARAARRAAQELQTLLGKEPLVLLLSAQAAQIAGDGAAARTAFEALSEAPDTRVLGLHGLFVEARRQGEHDAARHFAEEATRIQPKIGWAGSALFEYQARAGEWQAALATLATNADGGIVERARARRLRAVLATGRAMELEAGEPDEARGLALEAHKLAPDLVPAASVAARLFVRAGDIRRATRILEATWKLSPHPELAEAYSSVRPGDSVLDRLKRVKRLASLRANHPEGALAVARAAIDAHDWQGARDALGGAMRANPTERVCLFMAEIEEGEHGDQGRVRGWLARALDAPRDPVWSADGHAFANWAPVSPISGRVDAFEWRVAADRPPGRVPVEIQSGGGETAESGGRTMPAIVQAALDAPSPLPAGGAPATMAPSVVVAVGAAKGVRPMARAPDDPGPLVPGEDDGVVDLPIFHPGRTA